MYTGTNPTALQSQQWIAESLVTLMDERPYRQITIRDICERADLVRQTFYNLFDSKEEVLRFQLRRCYVRQFQRFVTQETVTAQDVAGAFGAVVDENEHLLSLMVANNLDWLLTEEIAQAVSLFADRFVRDPTHTEHLEYAKALLAGALAHLLLCWYKDEEPISVAEMGELIAEFLEGGLFELN